MADAYAKVKRGGLKLKGGMKKKRKRERAPKGPEAAAPAATPQEDDEDDFVVAAGSGRISSSGTAVRGHDGTRFMTELLRAMRSSSRTPRRSRKKRASSRWS